MSTGWYVGPRAGGFRPTDDPTRIIDGVCRTVAATQTPLVLREAIHEHKGIGLRVAR